MLAADVEPENLIQIPPSGKSGKTNGKMPQTSKIWGFHCALQGANPKELLPKDAGGRQGFGAGCQDHSRHQD